MDFLAVFLKIPGSESHCFQNHTSPAFARVLALIIPRAPDGDGLWQDGASVRLD